jgi:hypothetical protein
VTHAISETKEIKVSFPQPPEPLIINTCLVICLHCFHSFFVVYIISFMNI